jgi:hypothetical protein
VEWDLSHFRREGRSQGSDPDCDQIVMEQQGSTGSWVGLVRLGRSQSRSGRVVQAVVRGGGDGRGSSHDRVMGSRVQCQDLAQLM